jgi:hypothetical protein
MRWLRALVKWIADWFDDALPPEDWPRYTSYAAPPASARVSEKVTDLTNCKSFPCGRYIPPNGEDLICEWDTCPMRFPLSLKRQRRHRLLRLRRRRAIFYSYDPPYWANAVVIYHKKDNPHYVMLCYRSDGFLFPLDGRGAWWPDHTWQLYDIWLRPKP